MIQPGHRHRRGVVRREFLQVGFSGFLGLGLPGLLAARANPQGTPRAKSVILAFMTGGPSHHETFDPKPGAPAEIRGEFGTIETAAPGLVFAEHLPGLAQRAGKMAVVRSMSHPHNNHLNATHQILTGQPQPGAFFDKVASRDDYPCYAATLAYAKPPADGTPAGVMLPTYLMEGPLTWPGQHAGFLGPKFDPWQIRDNPNGKNFKVESLTLPEGFSVERLGQRRDLYDTLATQADDLWGQAEGASFEKQRHDAYAMLLNGAVAKAFRLGDETLATRDRYGRHPFGQSLLLARRLAEAGVPMVQVNLGRVQNWDSHADIFRRLKDDLLPPTDRGLSALLDDLAATGMLDETLVVIAGEFGRTPKLSVQPGQSKAGRDHWPQVFSVAFAGAGVVGGRAIGQSDAIGAYPASRPYTPADLAATIYRALGVDPETELRDRLNRPIQVVTGRPIDALYGEA